ncbi:MAG TPA: hypothetical protein VMV49_01220 [Candidatus Deferrimicrobium sp.]|nr:hypothetical protein [Candidatus Deferrimicrobium sp.]
MPSASDLFAIVIKWTSGSGEVTIWIEQVSWDEDGIPGFELNLVLLGIVSLYFIPFFLLRKRNQTAIENWSNG